MGTVSYALNVHIYYQIELQLSNTELNH